MGYSYRTEKIYPIENYLFVEDFIQNRRNKNPWKITSKKATNFVVAKECRLFDLCRYCTSSFYNECCLVYNLKHKDFPKNCGDCYNKKRCKRANGDRISIKGIPDFTAIDNLQYRVRNPIYGLQQNYIPKIDIDSPNLRAEQIRIIRSCKINILNVSLQKMMASTKDELIKKKYLLDLHKFLDFHGKILLTTNIKDKFCDKIMQNIPKFIEQVNLMNVDIMTTLDANFYWDQPLFITLLKLKQITIANRLIQDINCSQIGLVPPMIPFFTKKYIQFMLNSNFKVIGIPMQEINKDNERGFKSKIFHLANSLKTFNKFKLLLISTSPTKINPRNLIFSDYYTSLSWTMIKNSKLLSKENINHKRKQKLLDYNNLAISNKNLVKSFYNKWW